jgi:DNA-binding NarL/FixJ family response regulator
VKRARLIIGDRHQLMAESIKGLVEPSYEVVETVFDFNSLPMAVQNQKPDVLVVDFSLFFNNGSNLMQVFKKKNFDI